MHGVLANFGRDVRWSLRLTEADPRAKARGGPVAARTRSWANWTPIVATAEETTSESASTRCQQTRGGGCQSAVGIDVRNLREFFRDSVHEALHRQHVSVEEHTEHYVVNLLTMFARSEALFEPTAAGARLRPLALMLAEAADARSTDERSRALQRLGDVSLFVAGFFAQSFAAPRRHQLHYVGVGTARWPTTALAARGGALAGVW